MNKILFLKLCVLASNNSIRSLLEVTPLEAIETITDSNWFKTHETLIVEPYQFMLGSYLWEILRENPNSYYLWECLIKLLNKYNYEEAST